LAAGSLLSARMRSFLGFSTATSLPAPHVVLLAPLDWRERMSALTADAATDETVHEEILNVADSVDAPPIERTPSAAGAEVSAPVLSAPSQTVRSISTPVPAPTTRPAPPAVRRTEAPSEARQEQRTASRMPAESVGPPRVTEPPAIEAPSIAAAPAAPAAEQMPVEAALENSNRIAELDAPTEAPRIDTEQRAESHPIAIAAPVTREAPVARQPVEAPVLRADAAPRAARPTPAKRVAPTVAPSRA